MAKTTAKPLEKTAANEELPKRNDGIHPPIVESEGIVGEPLRLGKGTGGDEVRGCALRATSTPRRRQYTRNEPSRSWRPRHRRSRTECGPSPEWPDAFPPYRYDAVRRYCGAVAGASPGSSPNL